MKKIIISSVVMAVMLFATAAFATIKVGLLSDLTGPTSSVGTPYAQGIKDCTAYVNANGGINGEQIELIQVDYAYNVQQALSAYKRFKSKGIVALQGWGTGDTEALVRFVSRDKIPVFSASYSPHLMDPSKAPYNFTIAPDYSTQGRAGLKYIKDTWTEKRAPRIAFVYPDKPYGHVPLPAMKEYAKELGFEVTGDETLDLKAMDATPQILGLKKQKADFVWVGGTTPSTAVLMKDAEKLGFKGKFLVNIWGNDENLAKMAGPACEGNLGMQAAAVYGQDVPGMKIIETETKGQPQMTHYLRGFVSTMVMVEGMKKAAANGKITGENIKNALETMRDYDPMGLAPAISFYPEDHRPSMAVNVCTVKDGKLEFVQTVSLPRDAKWLGK
ncbi:amino acid/amide ABC transporter substrate-binding protein, HAAT family (TC 3.A.1.4.-) [Maridesulfovibrio ferrireducens]|uniref:Amino acid/amide ABC transporter substrate-binding protein, HAAT family (TC 3.A.1.4.-) n=1 Tax=Maridesulfovibrio ferrireducens TaxID=246191 RepID=A0A1G9KPT2_9BACT|nr:ABC transporter substrate-binding protein [Maridesulfovibrio ferrireducens]SDL51544.1 amino acid/amide ABC transporter substrate-binding protein, HAAT family (TC 3.A.1.4.-) [Maridesulfovibrio ferrireducens]